MDYSVVIPVFNEEDSAVSVYGSVNEVLGTMGRTYEIIFVDDCSTDATLQRLKQAAVSSGHLIVVALAARVGQSEAMQAGFDHASGDICISLDGDGQYDPRDIPYLLAKLAQGYDVVCGWRFPRRDPLYKKVVSRAAYSIRRLTTHERIHDVGCTLRVFRKKDIRNICLWSGLHIFFAVLMERRGYKVGEIKVIHYPRRGGVSKYGVWRRLVHGAVDLFRVSFIDIDVLMDHKRSYAVKYYDPGANKK